MVLTVEGGRAAAQWAPVDRRSGACVFGSAVEALEQMVGVD